MVEVLFWLVLVAYVLYVSQVVISLIYWSLCLIPWGVTFKEPTTSGVRSVIKLDLLSNVARLLWCSSYPLFLLWGNLAIGNHSTGAAYFIVVFGGLNAFRIALREAKTLDDDYEDVMPNFAKYFKYGLFSYYRLAKGYLNV